MRAGPVFAILMLAFVPAAVAAPVPQKTAPQKPAVQKPESADALFARLARAQSPDEAKPVEEKLLLLFKASGSASIDLLMNRAEVAMAAHDEKMARRIVDAVTAIAPGYAEGWHARAALETEAGDDAAAMVSLQKTVALNPRQFNALNELAGMLEDYGDKAGALKLYRRALALNPQLDGVARHVQGLTRQVEGRDI